VIEQIFQIMKKDMSVMKECGMCPSSIVQVKEIIEDGKTALVFTTEPVICSLADLLSQFFEIPNGRQLHAHHFEIGNTLSELEMSRGILNITEGLQYFHTVQRKLHLNLCPESIVITQDGHWKLCGFGLALSFQQGKYSLTHSLTHSLTY
jgi:SCY1-like protein 2